MPSLLEDHRLDSPPDGPRPALPSGRAVVVPAATLAVSGGLLFLATHDGSPVWRAVRLVFVVLVIGLALNVLRRSRQRLRTVAVLGLAGVAVPVGAGFGGPHLAKTGLSLAVPSRVSTASLPCLRVRHRRAAGSVLDAGAGSCGDERAPSRPRVTYPWRCRPDVSRRRVPGHRRSATLGLVRALTERCGRGVAARRRVDAIERAGPRSLSRPARVRSPSLRRQRSITYGSPISSRAPARRPRCTMLSALRRDRRC